MTHTRILALAAAALVAVPALADARPKRPAHIDRIAWRNATSQPQYSNNHRPNNRVTLLQRVWHPKRKLFSQRSSYNIGPKRGR